MRNHLFLLLLSFFFFQISSAQDKIVKGTKLTILEIGSDDSYYSERATFVGSTATALADLTKKANGFYSGTLETDKGRTCFFMAVKLAVTEMPKTQSSPIKFITGTIKKGTSVYVADISSDDSYYSSRAEKVGKKGKIGSSDLSMKEDGWYAGNFTYDDGTTAYFYKVKFSNEPVAKLNSTSQESKESDTDPFGFGDLLGWSDDFSFASEKSSKTTSGERENTTGWGNAYNDKNIKEGEKVEITAISPDDSYYEDREDYIGKKGTAGDDLDFQDDEDAYGGTVKLDGGDSPYFYLVKLKKISKSNTSSSSTSTQANMPKMITKNTKIKITEVGPEDSFYAQRSEYIGKTGKVAESLNLQSDGYYSGEIYFDYGKEVYFFNIKVSIIK